MPMNDADLRSLHFTPIPRAFASLTYLPPSPVNYLFLGRTLQKLPLIGRLGCDAQRYRLTL